MEPDGFFQKIRLLKRLPFFLDDVVEMMCCDCGRDSIDSLLFSPNVVPTRRERLAMLDRLALRLCSSILREE